MIKRETFQAWLDAYGAGWVNQDPKRTLSLFSDDASYMYTPFHKIMKGKAEIRRYIEKGAVGLQQDIEFRSEILALTETFGIAHWTAALTWKPTGERLRFDGIYQVFLNEAGLCTRFDEWWHAKPPLPDDNAPEE